MDTLGWIWVGWGVYFAVVEGYALYTDKKTGHGTLSAHLRLWFKVDTKLGRTIFLFLFGGFCFWFVPHIVASYV